MDVTGGFPGNDISAKAAATRQLEILLSPRNFASGAGRRAVPVWLGSLTPVPWNSPINNSETGLSEASHNDPGSGCLG